MAYFLVTYDVVEGNSYDEIIKELERLEAVRTQASVWLLDIRNTAHQVKTHLAQHLEDDDKLMVVEFDKEPAWTRGFKGTKTWIDERF